jgi:hypothetical protein
LKLPRNAEEMSPWKTKRISPRLAQSLVIGIAMATVTAVYEQHRVANQPSDFAQVWAAARAWLHGMNPYTVLVPGQPFLTTLARYPLFYPMPAVLAAVPFVGLPLVIVDPLFVGLSAAAFAWVLMRERLDDPRLLVFPSAAGALFAQTSQWGPLLCAATFVPALAPLLACKPTLGLALLTGWPSRQKLLGMAAFTLVSLLAWPSWPGEWFAGLSAGTHLIAPITRPGGFLILLALARWQLGEARFLVAWACMPQTPFVYEAVPLFLLPKTWAESIGLTALVLVAGIGHRYDAPYATLDLEFQARGMWMLWLLFIPCTLGVLLRPGIRPIRGSE